MRADPVPLLPSADDAPLRQGGAPGARAWRIASLAMIAASLIVIVPFAPWLVLASWFARGAKPTLRRLSDRIGGRARAAAVLTLGLLLSVCGPVIAVTISLTLDAVDLGRRVASSTSGHEALSRLVTTDDGSAGTSGTTLLQVAQRYGEQALSVVTTVAGTTLELALGLFVFFSAAYFLLVESRMVRTWVDRYAPVDQRSIDRLDHAFHETGRGLFVGIGMAALAQATVATIAYAALGVPRALVLGFVTLIAALVPSVGTALVWIPISAALAINGRTTEAIILAVIGVVVIGSIDNVLRPYLTRWGHLDLHPFVVLVSMLGGLALIGGWGLIMGPLVVRLTAEVLRIAGEREMT